jgi:FixJ family two-component response regulator
MNERGDFVSANPNCFVEKIDGQGPQRVLVDDDLLVRMTWQMMAKKKGLSLLIYDDPRSFINDCEKFNASTIFYLDQDIGPKGKGAGVLLACLIKNHYGARAYTHLVTGHSRSEFFEEVKAGIVNGVDGKECFPDLGP